MAVNTKYTLQKGWSEAIRNERICLERDMLFKNIGGQFGLDLEKE